MESRYQRNLLTGQKDVVIGLPVPLFDRFNEELDDARIREPYRIQELSLLLESIQKQLENLLNTRLPPRDRAAQNWEPLSEPQTVLDYGIPELSTLSSSNPAHVFLLCRVIEGKVSSFEPRLENPRVQLHPIQDDPTALAGTLSGVVRLQRIGHPVNFPVNLHSRSEQISIAPPELV